MRVSTQRRRSAICPVRSVVRPTSVFECMNTEIITLLAILYLGGNNDSTKCYLLLCFYKLACSRLIDGNSERE